MPQTTRRFGPEDDRISGEIVARGRGRPKVHSDEEQRAKIVRLSLDLFVRNGYGATSMDDIAHGCHISKRTLYRLFPRKIDLFAAMVEEHRHSMLIFPTHDSQIAIETQLERVFLVDIGPEAEQQRAGFIRMAVIESRHFPELRQIMRKEGGDKSKALLADWLAEATVMGLIDVDDPMVAAGILMDMMFGAIALKTGQGEEWPGDADRPAYMRQCIRYFVNGIRNR